MNTHKREAESGGVQKGDRGISEIPPCILGSWLALQSNSSSRSETRSSAGSDISLLLSMVLPESKARGLVSLLFCAGYSAFPDILERPPVKQSAKELTTARNENKSALSTLFLNVS